MATVSKYYKKSITDLLATKTIYCALMKNTLTIGAGHQYYSDISAANEVVGTGYTAGGIALAALASTQVGDNAKFTAGTITFSGITLSAAARYAIMYNFNTGEIISEHDLGGDKQPSGGSLIITINANGILTVS